MKTQIATLSTLLIGAASTLAHPGHGTVEHQVSSASPLWWIAAAGMLIAVLPFALKLFRK